MFQTRYGGSWMGFSVGAEVSLTNPDAQAGHYLDSDGKKEKCHAGYWCPAGLEGVAADFTETGKYHGGSPAWKSEVKKRDLRCGANYFCPEGSTTEQGKPVIAHTKLQTKCAKGTKCPCESSGNKYCGLAAKKIGGDPTLCEEGYYCIGGERKPCEAGYFCNQKGMDEAAMKTKKCEAGYYCPEGSTTETGQPVIDPVVTGPGKTETRAPDQYRHNVDVYTCHAADSTSGTRTAPSDCLCQPGYYCPGGSADNQGNPVDIFTTECTGVTAAVTQSTCQEVPFGPKPETNNYYMCKKDVKCKCGLGHYCPRGSASPQGRPVEDYKDTLGTVKCASNTPLTPGQDCPCDAGSYCDEGQSSPTGTECPANFYCPQGTYLRSGTKDKMQNTRCDTASIPAAVLFVRHDLECACNYGFQCEKGSKEKKGATIGAQQKKCPKGLFCQPTGKDPVKCPKGYYCIEGVDAQKPETDLPPCTATHFCPEGSTKAEGHPLDETAGCGSNQVGECECAKGYFCPVGSSSSKGYPVKSKTEPTGPISIIFTSNVFATRLDDQTKLVCELNKACKCPAGKWCGPGTTEADMIAGTNNCDVGFFCPKTSTAKTGKPEEDSTKDNEKCNKGDECTCPKGFYCNSGYGVPRACTPGYYCKDNTQIPTLPCDEGYYCPATSTTSKGKPEKPSASCAKGHECTCKAGFYCEAGSRDEEGQPKSKSNYPYPYDDPTPPVVVTEKKCAAGYFCPKTSTAEEGNPAIADAQCPGTGKCKCRAGWYCGKGSTKQADAHTTSKCTSNFWCPKTSTTNKGKPAEASSGQVTVPSGTTLVGTDEVPPGTYNGDAVGDFGTVNRAPSCAPSCASFCSVS